MSNSLMHLLTYPLVAVSLAAAVTTLGAGPVSAQSAAPSYKFSFSPNRKVPGYTQVHASTAYSDSLGYGFEHSPAPVVSVFRGGDRAIDSGYCTSAAPFYFSVKVPEGNYDVLMTLGDRKGMSMTTVKSEVRRLMLPLVETKMGQVVTKTITCNVRVPQISTGGSVSLKPRERMEEFRNWDDKLTLEFSNANPCVDAIKIVPVNVPTVFIASDSTVTDQGDEPWTGWGQVLPMFFKPGIAVANYAESGDSAASFIGAGRLKKIMSIIKPGDYLFILFGDNDQKEHGPGVGPYTTYEATLRSFISQARAKGAHPILFTPMNRRFFNKQGQIINTSITPGPDGGDYVQAVRNVAAQEKVRLIDMNAMTKILFEAMGPKGTEKAFVYFPANSFPGQTKALHDNTHFNMYGAFEMARCVVKGIKQDKIPLTHYLRGGLPPFRLNHPDPTSIINIPYDPQYDYNKPYGD